MNVGKWTKRHSKEYNGTQRKMKGFYGSHRDSEGLRVIQNGSPKISIRTKQGNQIFIDF